MTSTKDQRRILIKIVESVLYWAYLTKNNQQVLFSNTIFSRLTLTTEYFSRKSQKEKFCRLLFECQRKKLIDVRELYTRIKQRKDRTFVVKITKGLKFCLKEFEEQLLSLVESKTVNHNDSCKIKFPFVDLLLKGILKDFNPEL